MFKNYKITNSAKRNLRGFTLVEMMVSIGIITLLSIMILSYNRRAETITALTRSANKLVFELQRIQNEAMLVYQTGEEKEKICGWGIYIPPDFPQKEIISFADLCTENNKTKGDTVYSEGETKEEIPLVKQTEIFDSNIESVVFVPPEPRIYFNPQNINKAIIKLKLENQLSKYPYYEIIISKSGQIYKKQILTVNDEEK